MDDVDDITYTLIFGIIPNKDGTVKSVSLSCVWDFSEGKTVADFMPSKNLIDCAEKQFRQMAWEYTLDEKGNINEQSGYCYYCSSKPEEIVCSNDLSR